MGGSDEVQAWRGDSSELVLARASDKGLRRTCALG